MVEKRVDGRGVAGGRGGRLKGGEAAASARAARGGIGEKSHYY